MKTHWQRKFQVSMSNEQLLALLPPNQALQATSSPPLRYGVAAPELRAMDCQLRKREMLMALTSAYLMTTKNLEAFMNALRAAKAPERFNNKFLTQLDFTSSNDRLFIGLLKGLGFIDESGVPTKRYYAFLDQTESGKILAEAVREAYEDLFAVNKKAQDLSVEEIKNKLKTLTQGQKSDNVVGLMASTFKAVAGLADWKAPHVDKASDQEKAKLPERPAKDAKDAEGTSAHTGKAFQLHYDIHIHLPESRDPAVFDAIFEAMKKHLSS